jgi:4-hydroxy-3-methylbut-2-en-1-yl diphosphate synthase IspG/GcpE
VVNGPGEAREADLGIAGGKRVGVLFRKGEIVKKIREKDFLDVLLREIRKMIVDRCEIRSSKPVIRSKFQCSNFK